MLRAHRVCKFAFFINRNRSLGDVSGELLLKRPDVATSPLWPRHAALIRAGALGIGTGHSVDSRAARHESMSHRRAAGVSEGV
jgi:hypothetical protein